MSVREVVTIFAVAASALPVTWAGDDTNRSMVAVAAASQEIVKPWIHHKMAPEVRAKLEDAFALALKRVRTRNRCAALFTRLGADGIEVLKTGIYLPVPNYYQESVVCGRNPATNSRIGSTLAYAKVGGSPTWICRHFSLTSTEAAAVVIIHEALHHAGLDERPHDRMAMSSPQISEMIRNACDL